MIVYIRIWSKIIFITLSYGYDYFIVNKYKVFKIKEKLMISKFNHDK